jgi:hypothetical protein
MRQVMRGFSPTVLLVAAAGCSPMGYDGPPPRGSVADRLFLDAREKWTTYARQE